MNLKSDLIFLKIKIKKLGKTGGLTENYHSDNKKLSAVLCWVNSLPKKTSAEIALAKCWIIALKFCLITDDFWDLNLGMWVCCCNSLGVDMLYFHKYFWFNIFRTKQQLYCKLSMRWQSIILLPSYTQWRRKL